MAEMFSLPRSAATPLPEHQIALSVDGRERTRWHYGHDYPRPFFYPFVGPSGAPLTRMGHPGAANHDHHRSIWFAHHKLLGIDFWSEGQAGRIRQRDWLVLEDGDVARMAVRLDWLDGHDPAPLLEQELIATLLPGENGETLLELQATFRPRAEEIEFGQTNFGFLAVRVAKSISAHFGGGDLRDSEQRTGEKEIFGNRAAWMDYSGPVRAPGTTETVVEGITYFDHPDNPGYPNAWHVRADGWMGASICRNQPLTTSRNQPLRLRFLLHAHAGVVNRDRAAEIAAAFADRPWLTVIRSRQPHRQWEIT